MVGFIIPFRPQQRNLGWNRGTLVVVGPVEIPMKWDSLGKNRDRLNGLTFITLRSWKWSGVVVNGFRVSNWRASPIVTGAPFVNQINQIRWWLIEEFSPDLIRFGSESFWFEPFVLKFTRWQAKKKHVTKTMGPLFGLVFLFFFLCWIYISGFCNRRFGEMFWLRVLGSSLLHISTQAKGFLFSANFGSFCHWMFRGFQHFLQRNGLDLQTGKGIPPHDSL